MDFDIIFNRSSVGWGLDLSCFRFLDQVTGKSSTYRFINKKSFELLISVVISSIDYIHITWVRSRRMISGSGLVNSELLYRRHSRFVIGCLSVTILIPNWLFTLIN